MLNKKIKLKATRFWQILKATGISGLAVSGVAALLWPFLKNKDSIIAKVLNYKLYLNPDDQGISRELYMYGVHEPITTRLIYKEIKPGMHIIDIGANLGYYAIMEGLLVGPSGRVLAIEPYPQSQKILKENVRLNSLEKTVVTEQCAIGDANTTARLYICERANWNCLTPLKEAVSSIDVDVKTLDSINPFDRVDFLRMDVEGYEIKVIKGMSSVLRQFHPDISMELHPQIVGVEEIINMLNTLKQNGYYVKYIHYRKADLIGVEETAQGLQDLSIDELVTKHSELIKVPSVIWLSARADKK